MVQEDTELVLSCNAFSILKETSEEKMWKILGGAIAF